MTRWYCDRCCKEIPEKGHDAWRLKGLEGRFMIEVITGMDGSWNKGILCDDCVRALVAATADPQGEAATGGLVTPGSVTFVGETGCSLAMPKRDVKFSATAPVDVCETVEEFVRRSMAHAEAENP